MGAKVIGFFRGIGELVKVLAVVIGFMLVIGSVWALAALAQDFEYWLCKQIPFEGECREPNPDILKRQPGEWP